MIKEVIKRDGSVQGFSFSKIITALNKAFASYGKIPSDALVELIKLKLTDFPEKESIEKIQDLIEDCIGEVGEFHILKSFIKYRFRRKLKRESDKEGNYQGTTLVDCSKTIWEYVNNSDWRVKANSNTGYSHAGLVNNTAGKVIANFWLDQVFSPEEGRAHRDGDIYIHDLDNLSIYCVGHSLRRLLDEGFGIGPGRPQSKAPRHFQSALEQITNYMCVCQSEAAGAQAFSSVDTYLSPFIFIDDLTLDQTKRSLENMVFSLNEPSRWGQSPFTNVTLDLNVSPDMKEQVPMCEGDLLFQRYQDVLDNAQVDSPLFSVATRLAEKAIKRGKSNLLELTYGDFQPEVDQFVIAFYEILTVGDALGQPFTFPIPTINITEDFDWSSPVADAIFENASQVGSSYFQNFLGSQWMKDPVTGEKVRNPKAFKPSDIRSMCCRLQLDLTELRKKGGGLFGAGEMTGSIGVVTINCSRLGYVYSGNKEGLYKQLDYLLELSKNVLEKRRKFCEIMRGRGLYPYTSKYIPSWNTFFSTIGVNGMNEMCINYFKDRSVTTGTRKGIEFCSEVIKYIRNRITEFQEQTGNLYNAEAVPAEGTCYRLAKADKSKYPDIVTAGSGENIYYTNSSQLPANFTSDPFEALDLQDELQCLYTGGTVLHNYFVNENPDREATKRFVKTALENHRLPYLSMTPTFSVCPKHGRLKGRFDYCPHCDDELVKKYIK